MRFVRVFSFLSCLVVASAFLHDRLAADPAHETAVASFDSPTGDFLLIQHNTKNAMNPDGTNAFDRDWADFEAGFGDPSLDARFYWRGLQEMHKLTKSGDWELMVRLRWDEKDATPSLGGKWGWITYSGFHIGAASEGYTFTITAEKASQDWTQGPVDFLAMGWHADDAAINGRKFSTRDNDQSNGNCASSDSGWWWNACGGVLLNTLNPWWFDGAEFHDLAETVMAIRKIGDKN